MRFIHTSDWQLGKPFGRLLDEARAALQEALLEPPGAHTRMTRIHP
jgi:DNA repair exonuclease SbcCD nuclease subunit